MGGTDRSPRRNVLLYCLISAICLVVCICFPEWMPRCLLRLASGYDCPACGAQRALRCFAAGELRAGFWCNPYLMLLSPYVLLLTAAAIGGRRTERLYGRLTDVKVILLLVCLMLGWWILRNTSFWQTILETYGVSNADALSLVSGNME